MAPDDLIDAGQGLRPARPWRRGLPDRHEVELHPAGQPQAQVPRGQRRRVRAGHLQGHPAHDGHAAHARSRASSSRRTRSGPRPAFIYVRGEVLHVVRRLRAAAREAYAAGYLGANILGSGIDIDLVIHAGAGAYICGEETALLDSLEGRRGQPRLRPPFPAVEGLYASPDGGQQRRVDRLGARRSSTNGIDWFASMGTEKSKGYTHLLAVGPREASRPVRGAAGHHAARSCSSSAAACARAAS